MYKRTPRILLYEEVINQILTLIKDGMWKPDDKIPNENELSANFEVSRNTIREALKVLEHLKIIISRPGRGTFVSESSAQNIQVLELIDTFREKSTYDSLMDTRIIIEPELTYRAALEISEKEILRLEKIIENSFTAIEEGNFLTATVGFSFHMELAKISKNELLWKFLESITLELVSLRKVTMKEHDKEDLLNELTEHKKIFNLVKLNKAKEARNAMYQHLKNAQQSLNESNQ